MSSQTMDLSLDDSEDDDPVEGQVGGVGPETTPPGYSDYPYRLFDLFQTFTNRWIMVGTDSVVLIGDHILNNPRSLVSIANNRLQVPRETIQHLVGIAIAFHREYPDKSFLIDGLPFEVDPAMNYDPGTSTEAVFLRDLLVPHLRDAGHSYLARVGINVNKFLQSDAASSFVLSLQSGHSDAVQVDLCLCWSEITGYGFWHDLFPDQTVVWFANVVVRDFLHQTLSNTDSDIWIGFIESASWSHVPDIMHPVRTCRMEKASFALAWLVVELRALRLQPSPSESRSLTLQRVRMLGEEQVKIFNFLQSIDMRDDTYIHDALKQWLEFLPVGY